MSAIYDELVTLIVWIDWTTLAASLKSDSGCDISEKHLGSREKVEKTRIDVTWEHNSSISGNDEAKLCGWKPVRISEFMTSQLEWIIPYKWKLWKKGQTQKIIFLRCMLMAGWKSDFSSGIVNRKMFHGAISRIFAAICGMWKDEEK